MSPESQKELLEQIKALKKQIKELNREKETLSSNISSLQGSVAQYNMYLSKAPAILFQIAPDGTTVFVNKAVEQITGYSPEELLGKNWWEIFYPGELYRQVEALFDKFSEQKDVCQYLMSLQAKDGTLRHILWTSYNLWDAKGNLVEINGVGVQLLLDFQDTELAKALKELSLAYDSYKTIIDNAVIWIDLLDEKGNVVFWNRAAERISGYSREEVLGHNKIWEWLYPDKEYREEIFAKAMAIIRGEVVENLETVITTKDGRKRVIWWHSNNLQDEKGKIIGSIALGADVTELKKIEEQLRLANKMQGLGRLAGGIAHDFNNILSIVKGYTDLILENIPYDSPVREDLLEISEASERGAQLTRQLLAFSKRQTLEKISLDLNETITSMERMLRRILGEDINLVLNLEEELPPVNADPSQIEQVIFNLVINAREAMPGGGTLTISTSLTRIDYSYIREHPYAKPGDYVLLAVSDTGVGMSPEVRERIFEPFFSTKPEGVGFGLSMVYGIVNQHNGYIWVYSEPELGTTFKVYLPPSGEPAEKRKPREESLEIPAGNEAIILMEDERAVRALGVRILRQLGYRVFEAQEPEDALLILEKYPEEINLLITDVIMPRINGVELAEKARKIRPELKVLFISGYPMEQINNHGILKLEENLLEKPFSARSLAQKVRKILDQ